MTAAFLVGPVRGEITAEDFAQHYARNATVLRPIRSRVVVPDIQHSLIHLGVLAGAVLSFVTFSMLVSAS